MEVERVLKTNSLMKKKDEFDDDEGRMVSSPIWGI
jgi:hypothetical protein